MTSRCLPTGLLAFVQTSSASRVFGRQYIYTPSISMDLLTKTLSVLHSTMPHAHEQTPASEPALPTKKSSADMTHALDDRAVQNRRPGSPRSCITHFLPVTILGLFLVAATITSTASSAALPISSSSGSNEVRRRHLAGSHLVKRTELGTGQLVGIIVGAVILVVLVGIVVREFNRGMMMTVRDHHAQNIELRRQGG